MSVKLMLVSLVAAVSLTSCCLMGDASDYETKQASLNAEANTVSDAVTTKDIDLNADLSAIDGADQDLMDKVDVSSAGIVKNMNHGTYTVQKGDTLGTLSQKFYNDSAKWETLYNLNKDSVVNPHNIEVGDVLRY